MSDETDWPRLARYVTGACSDEERRAMEAWIAQDPARRETVDAVRRIWERAEPAPERWNVPVAWRELVQREAATRDRSAVRLLRPAASAWPERKRRWLAPSLWAAAAAAVVLGVAIRGKASPNRLPAEAPAPLHTVRTAAGQRMDLRLPDGTRVLLSVASTLRYPSTYGADRRDVYLDGEAYFVVTHDSTKPFTVYADHAVARDLGTRFVVRKYADEDRVQVVVAEGKVALRGAERGGAPAREALLTAGQLGRVDAAGDVQVRARVALDDYLAWTEGRLVFKDVRLRDLLPQLARWYDLELRLADARLGERRLTGTFRDEPPSEVLQFLALSLDARYQRDGRAVTFAPKRRTP